MMQPKTRATPSGRKANSRCFENFATKKAVASGPFRAQQSAVPRTKTELMQTTVMV